MVILGCGSDPPARTSITPEPTQSLAAAEGVAPSPRDDAPDQTEIDLDRAVVGAREDSLSSPADALLYNTRRSTLVLRGEVRPPDAVVRFVWAKRPSRGWGPPRAVTVSRKGRFSIRLNLARGETDVKISAKSSAGSATQLVGITRRGTVQRSLPAPLTCREPSGQEKASLRFAVRAHDRELKDAPWAIVQRGGSSFMAAEIDAPGPRLMVLVRFPEDGAYLSGMKAVNGTARTFTDLPDAGDRIPAAGQRALDCVRDA